jgi:preprotein translocase subunit SecF
MELIKPGTNIPFTKYRNIAVVISTIVNVAIIMLLIIKGPDLGVDFAGGTVVQLRFVQKININEVRAALGELGSGDTVIQDFGQQGSNEFLVRLVKTSVQLGALGDEIRSKLTQKVGPNGFEIRRIESVGPKVGSELRQRGTWSVIAATIMMGVYIWFRFEFRFGIGAVIALIHDVLVTIGALMVAGYEFDLTIIAALLTIVGYSVNDTVIVCDRVRENMRKVKRESLENVINTSINETLSRTIITTGTALLVLLALFILGGGVIRPFAFALLVGFFSGVYSTIFIATPVVLMWEKTRSTRAVPDIRADKAEARARKSEARAKRTS